MRRIKEKFSKILIIICGLILTFFTKVKADSGFDGSYDSGGSGGSSGGSYSGSSGAGGSGGSKLIFGLYAFFSIAYLFICGYAYDKIFKNEKENSKLKNAIFNTTILIINNALVWLLFDFAYFFFNMILSLSLLFAILGENRKEKKEEKKKEKAYKKLEQYIDINDFYQKAFNIYKDVQIAWMNNSLEDVRDVLTDELFNMYTMQLMTLTAKNQKNMMEDIIFVKAHLMDVRNLGDKEEIDVCLTVLCRDYIIDVATNMVLRGNKDNMIEYVYKLSFIRTKNIEALTRCPSCRGELEDQASTKCPYCDNIIVNESSKFVMAGKKVLSQVSKKIIKSYKINIK